MASAARDAQIEAIVLGKSEVLIAAGLRAYGLLVAHRGGSTDGGQAPSLGPML